MNISFGGHRSAHSSPHQPEADPRCLGPAAQPSTLRVMLKLLPGPASPAHSEVVEAVRGPTSWFNALCHGHESLNSFLTQTLAFPFRTRLHILKLVLARYVICRSQEV